MNDAALLEPLLRRIVREELRRALLRDTLPGPQRRLLDALRGEFADSAFASREVVAAARSPLKCHDALRQALAELNLRDAQAIGQALHRLPGVVRHKRERGSGVWSIEGPGPA